MASILVIGPHPDDQELGMGGTVLKLASQGPTVHLGDLIPGEPWYPKRVIYYFCTHLRMNFQATFCVDISDTIDRKNEAVKCYQSQFVGASGHVPEMVRTITAYFGSRIGTRHAEPFFTYE